VAASGVLLDWSVLPFSADQFFEILATYNNQFRVAVAGWWIASLGVIVATWCRPARFSRLLTSVLAAMWAWNALAYHAFLFTRINPAAWLFAALFAIEALLLSWTAARRSLDYFTSRGPMSALGLGLVSYSFAYPFLSALGHAYPATPTFGLPCPTTILTIGLLLTIRGEVPIVLAIVPAVWALIGGSAAVLLRVPTDFALLGAGLLLIVLVGVQRNRAMRLAPTAPAEPARPGCSHPSR
jgi:uncharacterized protein DUF6064